MTDANRPPESEHSQPAVRINPIVFYGSAIVVVAFACWAIIVPQGASDTIGVALGWISEWFGWFYILFATVFLAFVVFLALSRYGKVRMGPEHSKPDFNLFSWASMLFAAGIGTDVMFFSVAEPVTQYLAPPVGQGETIESARQATVWMLFHYGITGWGMYALMGIALAYFAYRRNLPLSVRSALYPLFGRRIYGALGHGIDLAAVLGTIFGIATSLGIGVVQLNFGLKLLFGIPQGLGAQIGLVVLAVIVATISSISGIDRGIRRLSELNVILALGLAGFVLVTGRTVFLLNAFVLNINDYVSQFMDLTMQTFAFDQPTAWLNAWTLFFWAWWVAWASFVGMFLARISRGRTIREFVVGTLIIPFSYILMWVSIFGNSAIDRVRNGDSAFGQLAMNHPESGFYTLLQGFPAFGIIASLATVIGLLFYITSADSGALVMGNLTSYRKTPRDDASNPVRIFWAMAIGLLTLAMLIVGGVTALQNATVIMGLPFAFVMILLMFGLYRALREEAIYSDSQQQSLPARLSARSNAADEHMTTQLWQRRLARTLHFAGRDEVMAFVAETALPALQEIADALAQHGVDATVHDHGQSNEAPAAELLVRLTANHRFSYSLRPRQASLPDHGSDVHDSKGYYYRLDVHLNEGGQDYDVMGYTRGQLIDDILDQYEKHVEYMRLHAEIAR